jgi:hypothetical protein
VTHENIKIRATQKPPQIAQISQKIYLREICAICGGLFIFGTDV